MIYIYKLGVQDILATFHRRLTIRKWTRLIGHTMHGEAPESRLVDNILPERIHPLATDR